jgi:CheY-like chemotaxis protein/two-component sensor histidine kinase
MSKTAEEQGAALQRLEAELLNVRELARRAGNERTRFIAAVSHDLLQPLSAARLYAATLMERAAGTEHSRLAQGIDASLATVEEIMAALLDLSRLESGPMPPAIATFAVAELFDKAAVEFAPLARSSGVALRVVSSSAHVSSDRTLLGRIVTNLLSNAIKYNLPGGRVLIGARRQGGLLRLDVVDTGMGIPAAQQEAVFEEFTRLAPSSRSVTGLGLGLSIVRRLADLLGLKIEVESAPGKGSRFSVYVPAATGDAMVALAASAAPVEPAPLAGGLRVLCIDNEPAIVGALSGLLNGWGCDVRVATSLKALNNERLLELWLPDLILMDYHLDQVSGLDAIEWLHNIVGAHVPGVLVTADHSETVRALARERGIPILRKPVKPAALRSLIVSLTAAAPAH